MIRWLWGLVSGTAKTGAAVGVAGVGGTAVYQSLPESSQAAVDPYLGAVGGAINTSIDSLVELYNDKADDVAAADANREAMAERQRAYAASGATVDWFAGLMQRLMPFLEKMGWADNWFGRLIKSFLEDYVSPQDQALADASGAGLNPDTTLQPNTPENIITLQNGLVANFVAQNPEVAPFLNGQTPEQFANALRDMTHAERGALVENFRGQLNEFRNDQAKLDELITSSGGTPSDEMRQRALARIDDIEGAMDNMFSEFAQLEITRQELLKNVSGLDPVEPELPWDDDSHLDNWGVAARGFANGAGSGVGFTLGALDGLVRDVYEGFNGQGWNLNSTFQRAGELGTAFKASTSAAADTIGLPEADTKSEKIIQGAFDITGTIATPLGGFKLAGGGIRMLFGRSSDTAGRTAAIADDAIDAVTPSAARGATVRTGGGAASVPELAAAAPALN